MKIIILGAGQVGRTAAQHLAREEANDVTVVDTDGNILQGAASGNLVILDSWPGQMRTVYGDHKRFADTYFSTYKGKYFTGDGCRRDADGYYWITGRVDDVINVSGHRIGTAEIYAQVEQIPEVLEAIAIGQDFDNDVRVVLFVRCKGGISHNPAESMTEEDAGIAIAILLDFVRNYKPA